jgi:hypothetical protein
LIKLAFNIILSEEHPKVPKTPQLEYALSLRGDAGVMPEARR